MQTISVVGLGKLGSPLLAACASRGFNVIGVDVNTHVVKLINQGKAPVDEPGLKQLISKNHTKIKATQNYTEAVSNSDITFIIVPTPSTKNGAFSNEYVLNAVAKIGKVLAEKNKFHLVVVSSTVMPKSMEKEVIPALEKASGKTINREFGVCYNPEFIALGSVIQNLINPDFVLIGQSNNKSGRILEIFYQKFCQNKTPVIRMNFINAEIAKIALNSYITTKISFANTLAQICQKVPEGSVDKVTNALGLDSRIGKKYLKGALPYGGPCFPRDNRAFSYFAKKVGAQAPLAKVTDKINQNLVSQIVAQIEKASDYKKNNKIAVLGLAYKPNTDVAEESAGVNIANKLAKSGFKVKVWDPLASADAEKYLDKRVKFGRNLEETISKIDLILITTPWKQFRSLNITPNPHKPILVDCWGILDPIKYQKVAFYKTIGKGDFSLVSSE